jgi:hypothetical protein
MIVTYSLGLAAASLWSVLVAQPVEPAYLVGFGLIFVGSIVLLAADLASQKRTAVAGVRV